MHKQFLVFLFLLLLTVSCGNSSKTTENKVDIKIIAQSFDEKSLNVMRDILSKNGFNPTISMLPDYASFMGQLEANNMI